MRSSLPAFLALSLSACTPDAPQAQKSYAVSAPLVEVGAVQESVNGILNQNEPEATEVESLSPERQAVYALASELGAELRAKYPETGFGREGKRLYITAPTGKKLAVSIQDQGNLVNINSDSSFHSTGETTDNAPFQLNLSENAMHSPFMSNEEFARYGEYLLKNDPQRYQEWTKYKNALDAVFTGSGAQLYYSMTDCSALFLAFGLQESDSPEKKAQVILETLKKEL